MIDIEKRIWSNVDIDWDTGCWPWQGTIRKDGYGYIHIRPKSHYAHRFVYETLIKKVPSGLYLDHLCRNRRCVNPNHLEIVTTKTNILRGISPSAINKRKTHCIRGHELKHENLKKRYDGARGCIICLRMTDAEAHKRKRRLKRLLKESKQNDH